MKKIVCTISKLEQDLDCWLDYYTTLGFDIAIFDDNESPIQFKNDNILIFRKEDFFFGNAKKLYEKKFFRQVHFYNNFVKRYCNDYDWVACLDCDEYLVWDKDLEIDNILKEYSDYAAVCPNWVIFGSNGHTKIPKGRVFKNFTKRHRYPNAWVKSILQPKYFKSFKDHHTVLSYKDSVTVNGEIISSDKCKNPTQSKLWINHYYCKSMEHWEIRMKRGQLSQHKHTWESLRSIDKNEVEDTRCKDLYEKYKKIYL